MPESRAIRPLSRSERMFVRLGTVVGYSLLVHGKLNPWLLSRAYKVVTDKYPALTARLRTTEHEVAVVESIDPRRSVTLREGDVGDPLAGVSVDPRRGLAALHIVTSDDRHAVTLLIHHAIADACHGVAILAEIWSQYTGLAIDPAATGRRHTFPKSFEAVSEERGIVGPPALVPTSATPHPRPPDPCAWRDGLTSSARIRLDTPASAALIAVGRRQAVTLNALLSAAIIRVESGVGQIPATSSTYFYPVNMRARLTPAVGDTAATNVLGFAVFDPDGADEKLIPLAEAVNRRLQAGLADGSVHSAGLHFPAILEDGLAGARRVFSSTNWGKVPPLRHPPELTVVDFRGIFAKASTHQTDATAITSPYEVPTYVILTFDDRLSIELSVTGAVDDKSAARRISALEEQLTILIR